MINTKLPNLFIQQCLAQIRRTQNLVELTLRLNPFLTNSYLSDTLQNQLHKQEKHASELLVTRRIQPPLFTCSPIVSTAFLLRQLIPIEKNVQNHQELLISMQKSQEWANDCIREMNEHDIQQKQVREVIIKFRNSLEQYTQAQEHRQGASGGLYSQFLKFVI